MTIATNGKFAREIIGSEDLDSCGYILYENR